MASQAAVERLPTFVALEALSVLEGERDGASVPFDATYFDGVGRATQATPDETSAVDPDTRLQQVQKSRLALNTTSVALDAFEREEVLAASDDLRETAEQLPEVEFLRAAFPGEVVVVPEWLRTGRMADWGMRAYFFREGEAPSADEIVERNVEAEVEGNRAAFERYQGDLHGYPECCIEAFHDRAQDRPDPEWRSVESLADEFRDEALRRGQNVSIDDVLPDFFESERAADLRASRAGRLAAGLWQSLAGDGGTPALRPDELGEVVV